LQGKNVSSALGATLGRINMRVMLTGDIASPVNLLRCYYLVA